MNKVTVVIPNYNGMKYICNCLDSLKSQEEMAFPFDVIVVDNGSADGSLELIRDSYPWSVLIPLKQNTGFCHAVNVGIQQSETPYVILLNNDTEVKAGFVRNLVEAMDSHKNLFSASARMVMWDRPDLIDSAGDLYCVLGWAFSRGKGKQAGLYHAPCNIFASCGGAAIYRKSVLDEIGLFDENHFAYLEDIDLGYRSQVYGYRSQYVPGAEVIHAGSASTGSRYNDFKTKHASANSIYLIGKNMPLLQILINIPFLAVGFFVKTLFFIRKKMGILYLKGLLEGFRKCFTEEGRKKKIPFQWKHLKNYIWIQLQLYGNVFRLITKR